MNKSETTKLPHIPVRQDVAALVRYWTPAWTRSGGRRALILLGIAVLGAGAALKWHWLTAIGVAPILLALAPCAALCALGLCMNKMGGRSCSTTPGTGNAPSQIAGSRSEPPSTAPSTESNRT